MKIKMKHVITENVCPTCMKNIKEEDTVEIDMKLNIVRHAGCAKLRPMQVKAIRELDRVMSSIKIRGL